MSLVNISNSNPIQRENSSSEKSKKVNMFTLYKVEKSNIEFLIKLMIDRVQIKIIKLLILKIFRGRSSDSMILLVWIHLTLQLMNKYKLIIQPKLVNQHYFTK